MNTAWLCNDDNNLVGMVTFDMILNTMDRQFLNTAWKISGFIGSEAIFTCVLNQPKRMVEELMLPLESISLRYGDTIAGVLKFVGRNDFEALPVLNENGMLTGFIDRIRAMQNLGLGSGFVKLGLSA